MVRLSTVYEKVYDKASNKDVSEKFFMLRGDEVYTRTTVCLVSVKNYNDDELEYYTVDVDVDVLRVVGTSQKSLNLYLNDDEIPFATYNVSPNSHSFTYTGLKLAYGIPYVIRGEYTGSNLCLGSKSKPVELEYDIPEKHQTMLVLINKQISTGENYPVKVSVYINGSSSASGVYDRPVLIYVDGKYVKTIITGDSSGSGVPVIPNVATGTLTGLSDGKHNITAEVESAPNINYASITGSALVGFKVEIIEYPSYFVQGENNTIKVKVTNYNDDPVVNEYVSFYGLSQSTDENGIATFIITNVENGSYYAEFDGSISENIILSDDNIYHPIIPSVNYDDGIVGYGSTEMITASINQNIANIPITFSGGINGTYSTNEYGKVNVGYNGMGSGKDILISVTAPYSMAEGSVTLLDCLHYFKSGQAYEGREYRATGDFKEFNSYYEMALSRSSTNSLVAYTNSPFAVSFKVAFNCDDVVIRMVSKTYGQTIIGTSNPLNLKAGDEVYMVHDVYQFDPDTTSGHIYLRVNGSSKSVTESTPSYAMESSIGFKHSGDSQTPLRFTEMKIYNY